MVKNQIQRKATLINEIVNELAFIRISNNFNERIDSTQIDSLFHLELANQGVHTPFVFDILDAETGRLSFREEHPAKRLILESDYTLQLFPNDYYVQSDTLLLYFPDRSRFIWLRSWKVLIISVIIILVMSYIFYSSISSNLKQKKLSQIKNDFINNMTHELKTPISTISLACEALNDKNVSIKEESRDRFVGMINNENKRLSLLVDNVLKSAVWDSGDMKLNIKPTHLHPIIQKVADSFAIQIEKKGGKLELELHAEDDNSNVDEVHFSNILYNLLDNANKYSTENPEIKVITESKEDSIEVKINDNGIGISKDDQKKVFDKFYRVHTGNVHEVKGFGLGLNYVKRMIETFGGNIQLNSKKGIGTNVSFNLKLNQ